MRLSFMFVLAVTMAVITAPAFAELQNVEVGGSLRIRGSWYSSGHPALATVAPFEEKGNSSAFVEQWTRLNVRADFTKDVSAFIELDSYDVWGEDFRGGAGLTGFDGRGATATDDVMLYQGYIETRETWGYPLTFRVGRQEIQLGSEWLVGNNDTSSFFGGQSFDGFTARYDGDTWNIMGGWTHLAENGAAEEDGDIDLSGIYGSYTGFENWTIDGYWLYLRDGRGANNTAPFSPVGLPFAYDTANEGVGGRILDRIESAFGVDQYDDTQTVHTLGLRGAGEVANFDLEAEVAYQIGEATNVTRTFFQPDPSSTLVGAFGLPIFGAYGDDEADYSNLGVNIQLGYTFDTSYQPRIWIGGAYFEGEDNRDDTFSEFLRSLLPFYQSQSSVGFNRLFSDWEYSEFLDATDLSNSLIFRGGVSVQPTEKVSVALNAAYFQADETTTVNGLFGIPFWGKETDDTLGWEIGLYLDYAYSEDLTVSFGYAHFFADEGVSSVRGNFRTGLIGDPFFLPGGNFVKGNGLVGLGGFNDDDLDYVYAETKIKF